MKVSCIDYNETHSFSPAIIRYLDKDPRLDQFQSHKTDINGFRELISQKKDHLNRGILAEVLTEQYTRSGNLLNSFVHRNINLLSHNTTYTVTTGHQLNLFTGPLYFIFKIVTAINLAKELKENFPDKDFVPVYWMATEDHDFAEINHTHIAGKKVQWDVETSGATGRISTKGIEKTVLEYLNTLGISTKAEKLGKLIRTAYLEHSNLADATRYLVNSLFEEYGLVIVDADDARLKKEFAPIITEDILHQHSYRHISETSKELQEFGLETPVNPREINFFYLDDNFRERIVFEEGLYKVLNSEISFTADSLKQEIEDNPQKFSPNVVMRPLYQEVILPNLAYIGGGAEIVYWLQLKKNFEHYRVDFPVLLLRNSAMITTNNLTAKLNRLNLGVKDIFGDLEKIKKDWVSVHTDHVLNLSDEWQEINSIFKQIKARTSKIDPTLGPSTEAVKVRLGKAFSNLESKLIKAEKRNFAEALTQIEQIKASLFPKGGLQERTENFGLLYVRYGDDLVRILADAFKPLDLKFTILEE